MFLGKRHDRSHGKLAASYTEADEAVIEALSKCATSKENVAPGAHPGEGGVNPTVALQLELEFE